MNDELEKKVLQNRDEFDELEPKESTWDSIETAINKEGSEEVPVIPVARGKEGGGRYLWRAGAAAIVIFSIGITYRYFIADPIIIHPIAETPVEEEKPYEGVSLQEISPELAEVEVYYTSMVNSKMEELDQLGAREDESVVEMLEELEFLSSDYNELKKEVGRNADNEKIIEAMIENYRIKLEVLEDILNELKGIENRTTGATKEETYDDNEPIFQ